MGKGYNFLTGYIKEAIVNFKFYPIKKGLFKYILGLEICPSYFTKELKLEPLTFSRCVSSSIFIQYLSFVTFYLVSPSHCGANKDKKLKLFVDWAKKTYSFKKRGSKESNRSMNTCADNRFFLAPPQFKVVYLINGKFYRNSFSKWSKFFEKKYCNNTDIFFVKKAK